jgi:hypothetical protein
MMQQQNLINIDEKLQFVESYLVTYDNYSDEQIKDINAHLHRLTCKRSLCKLGLENKLSLGKSMLHRVKTQRAKQNSV